MMHLGDIIGQAFILRNRRDILSSELIEILHVLDFILSLVLFGGLLLSRS